MTKEEYIKITKEKLGEDNSKVMLSQIDRYYESKEYKLPNNKYKIGDLVKLKKGTLIHGTYNNMEALRKIVKDGLVSSWFVEDSRETKYPSSVGVWNLQKDYKLIDYLNYTNGATIRYNRLLENKEYSNNSKIELIPYDKMNNITEFLEKNPCWLWSMEQTKEARFLPSKVQDMVQIAIIFNGDYAKELLKGDILEESFMSDEDVKPYINEWYYERFIKERKNKDAFFTNRESAILFGLPSNIIEGVLVGRKYEKDNKILNEIKELLPNCYICNIDGIVIK